MKMELILRYKCPICGETFDDKSQGENCLNRGVEKTDFKVGDIIGLSYGFGWWDGDDDWVRNPEVDTSKHGFGSDCSYGFYYVITAIDNQQHRARIFVATGAMKPSTGYHSGKTFLNNHKRPVLIENPSKIIIEKSKQFIGKKVNYLI